MEPASRLFALRGWRLVRAARESAWLGAMVADGTRWLVHTTLVSWCSPHT
jgi:hypothetical protein